jgi:hypothetical protein
MIRRRSTFDHLLQNKSGTLQGPAMDTKWGREVDPDEVPGRPGKDLDGAMSRYETFHAKAPIRVAELDHELPEQWVCVGEALSVMYRTDKWHTDGDDEDYKHLHDDGDGKAYELGRGVKFYEPASEWSKSTVAGKHRGRRPKAVRSPVAEPEALTLLGYCLGVFVRLEPDHNAALSTSDYDNAIGLIKNARGGDETALEALNELSIFETNPRGCWLFCSPSGDMLTIYSPEKQPGGYSGFMCLAAGGKLRVLKDGIDG